MREILASPHHSAFMARGLDGAFVGFAEVALRYDYVNGCESSPVAFLEGIYTVEGARRQGWAARLIAQVQEWAKQQGCSELASDTDIANLDSQRLHGGAGLCRNGAGGVLPQNAGLIRRSCFAADAPAARRAAGSPADRPRRYRTDPPPSAPRADRRG